MIWHLAAIAAGIAVLAVSGDKLVGFAAAIARKAKMTPAVIGLTVISAGTSLPELFVSVTAALQDSAEIAVANVFGSNIANVALILGTCALVATMPITPQTFKFDYPVMLGASLVTLLLARDGAIDRTEGGFLLLGMVGFVAYSVWVARKQFHLTERREFAVAVGEEIHGLHKKSLPLLLLALVATFAGLLVGSRLLIVGAIGLSQTLGLSERVIGLTVVAVGTSLPELTASIAAALKKQHEMAVANIVGSNVFNLLLILGTASFVTPLPVAAELVRIDGWVMIGVTLLLFPLFLRGRSLKRIDGVILLCSYLAYMTYLVWAP